MIDLTLLREHMLQYLFLALTLLPFVFIAFVKGVKAIAQKLEAYSDKQDMKEWRNAGWIR